MHAWSHIHLHAYMRHTCLCAHIYLHNHTQLHTRVHARVWACNCMDMHQSTNMQEMPIHVCTHTNSWSHTCTHMCKVPMCLCTCMHGHSHLHTCMHRNANAHVRHTYVHTPAQAYVHINTHVNSHKNTHICTQTNGHAKHSNHIHTCRFSYKCTWSEH